MYQTTPGDQSHDNCPGDIYVGDGYVKGDNGRLVWGPILKPCGTCTGLGRPTRSITTKIDPYDLINDEFLNIPF